MKHAMTVAITLLLALLSMVLYIVYDNSNSLKWLELQIIKADLVASEIMVPAMERHEKETRVQLMRITDQLELLRRQTQ